VFEQGGFDIVIGNPPYVRADNPDIAQERIAIQNEKRHGEPLYQTLWEKWDLFVPFIELGYRILRVNGVETMIVSDAYCHSKYAIKSQEWFLKNALVRRLDFLGKLQLFDAGVRNMVFFYQRCEGADNEPERRLHTDSFGNVKLLSTAPQRGLSVRAFFPGGEQEDYCIPTTTLAELCYITKGMVVNADEKVAKGAFSMADLVVDMKDKLHPRPFVEGKHLGRWLPVMHKWLEWGTERAPALFSRPTFEKLYEVGEKILVQRSPGPDPKACYDCIQLCFTESSVGFVPWYSLSGVRNKSIKKVARYTDEPTHEGLPNRNELEEISRRFSTKYLLAVMNSEIACNFLRANRRSNIHLYPDDWKKLPIPDVSAERQAPIVALVDQILTTKQVNPNASISNLEVELDLLVSALYVLTKDEIVLIAEKI